MKRLIVCNKVDGGICHYTYCLAEALQHLDEEVIVLTSATPAYELANLQHAHQVHTRLQVGTTKATRLLAPFLNLRVLSQEAQNTPVVHFQWPLGPRTDILTWRALKKADKRIVYTAHNVQPHEKANKSESHVGWLYNTADAIIVHGQNLKSQLITMFPDVASKVHVTHLGNLNFIADQFSKWDRAHARTSFGWSDEEQVILFFGLIRAYKGLDTLIAACKILGDAEPTRFPRLRLLIAGASVNNHWAEGGYEKQLREAGLTDRTETVIEHISLEDIGRFLLASDVVALPYRSGSQSAILQLAFAFARPAIVTDVGSISEAVTEGVTGLIVPPESPEALATALRRLLTDRQAAEQIGRQARAYADTQLSWQQIARETRQIYASLL